MRGQVPIPATLRYAGGNDETGLPNATHFVPIGSADTANRAMSSLPTAEMSGDEEPTGMSPTRGNTPTTLPPPRGSTSPPHRSSPLAGTTGTQFLSLPNTITSSTGPASTPTPPLPPSVLSYHLIPPESPIREVDAMSQSSVPQTPRRPSPLAETPASGQESPGASDPEESPAPDAPAARPQRTGVGCCIA